MQLDAIEIIKTKRVFDTLKLIVKYKKQKNQFINC